MSNQWVLPLNDARATLNSVGGKGESLARLVNAGLPVPQGFHVTTQAYLHFIKANDLQAIIETTLTSIDLDNPSALESAAMRIQKAFMAVSMPDEISSAIMSAYGHLPGTNPAVAVRSSATAEDLPEASFAGQQESYLNGGQLHSS